MYLPLGKGLPGLIDLFNVNMSACSWHLARWGLQQGSERRWQDVEIIYVAIENATRPAASLQKTGKFYCYPEQFPISPGSTLRDELEIVLDQIRGSRPAS